MTRVRQQLITELVRDLEPVRPPGSPIRLALLWWLATWVWVAAIASLEGPPRSGAMTQLGESWQFLAESVLGLLVAAAVAAWAFADSIPGYARRALLPVALSLVVAWSVTYVIGLDFPALEPSMLGKRESCYIEILLYAVPPTIAAVWLANRRYVLSQVRSTAMLSLAAAMVPALYMQFACMYDPIHILVRHILPIPVYVAAATAVAASISYLLRRRRFAARG